jgi:phage terminase large subunit
MTTTITFKKSKFNEVFFPYLNCDTRTQIFFGGASSGKSFFILGQRTIYDLLKGGRNFIIARNTAKTNRTSTFNEVIKALYRTKGLASIFNVHKSDLTITCLANSNQAYFLGLDDVEKVKSITPAKGVITDIIVEECTETSLDTVKKLSKRLRGLSGGVKKRQTFLFNPIFKTHWLYTTYFAGRFSDADTVYHDDNLLIHKSTYLDNLNYLEQDDVDELDDETDPYYADVYSLGNWGILGDVIFKKGIHWQTADLSGIRKNYHKFDNGLDFGFTNSPTALVRCVVKGDKIYVFNTHGGKGWDNQKIHDEIHPIIGDEYVYCDSAEPKSIYELKKYGTKALAVKKGKDYLLHAIQWIQRHRLIVDNGCQGLINELGLFQWMKDKDGEAINKPLDKNNHYIDALHYGLSPHIHRVRGSGARVKY